MNAFEEKQIDYIFQKLKTMFSLNQMLQRFHFLYFFHFETSQHP